VDRVLNDAEWPQNMTVRTILRFEVYGSEDIGDSFLGCDTMWSCLGGMYWLHFALHKKMHAMFHINVGNDSEPSDATAEDPHEQRVPSCHFTTIIS
jgi:hypothetical protein